MHLERTVYSVLIVSSADNFADAITSLLSPCEHAPVERARSVSAAKRLLAQRDFDFIIINSPLSDENGIDFACRLSEKSAAAILVFARAEVFSSAYEALTPFGVFTLNKPLSQQTVLTALLWLAAARERLKAHEGKAVSLEQKMKEIRTVNKAKWFLIEHEAYTEAQAHRYIEKRAMDECVPKLKIANDIIQKYE